MNTQRGEYFENTPIELDQEYAMYLDYKDIINFCRTQTSFRKVCENDNFWLKKTEYELEKYEDDYDPTHYEELDIDGFPVHDYILLPQDEFLDEAIKKQEYHYIKSLFEIFDFSDEQLNISMRGKTIKDKRSFNFLWDKLKDRKDTGVMGTLIRSAVKLQEIDKIEEILKSRIDECHLAYFSSIINLPLKNFKHILKLAVHKQDEYLLLGGIINILLRDEIGKRKIKIYFENFPLALKVYIQNQIRGYNETRESGHRLNQSERKKLESIIDRLEFVLNNFLTPKWKRKISLSDEVIDNLLKMFELTPQDVKILESWRQA